MCISYTIHYVYTIQYICITIQYIARYIYIYIYIYILYITIYTLHYCLYVDRSANERIAGYQEWLKAPDYDGKSEEDIAMHTITSLTEVIHRLHTSSSSSGSNNTSTK